MTSLEQSEAFYSFLSEWSGLTKREGIFVMESRAYKEKWPSSLVTRLRLHINQNFERD